MARRFLLSAVSLATIAALSGCGSQSAPGGEETSTAAAADVDNAAAEASVASADASGAAAGTALPLTGQAYVDAAAAGDQFEIQSSRIAQSKGLTGEWRTFAEQMVKDHTQSSTMLKQAVGEVPNVKLDNTPKLTPEQQTQLTELQETPADRFQAVYARQQLAAHEKALAIHTTYSASGDAQPLMQFAEKAVPVVSGHLDHLRRMQ